jgi:two-component system sensor histidine kinase/response regulator
VAKYSRLLVLFADSCRQHMDKVAGMLARGEFDAIEPIAHSLRGSAAMLGAIKVSEIAGALLAACRNGAANDAIAPLCAVLAAEMSRLVDGIREAVVPPGEVAPVEVDARRLADVLGRLAALLEQGDMAASYLVRDELGLLHAALGDAAQSLLARIEAFDYENAAAELHELRSRAKGAAD